MIVAFVYVPLIVFVFIFLRFTPAMTGKKVKSKNKAKIIDWNTEVIKKTRKL